MSTHTADPLIVTATLPGGTAVGGATTVTGDPIPVSVILGLRALKIPADPDGAPAQRTHTIGGDWKGQFQAGEVGPQLEADIEELTTFGFRVLGTTPGPGETTVWVHSDETTARLWVSDIEKQTVELPGLFVPWDAGELITLVACKQWDPNKRYIH